MTVWMGARIANPHARLRADVSHNPTLRAAAEHQYNYSLVQARSDAMVGWNKEDYSYLKKWRY